MTKKTDIFADNWNSQDELIKRMKEKTNVLKTARIETAFQRIDRKDFVRDEYQIEAYEDYPIPIGGDQTISQPTTVAYMLELLHPKEGNTILDVGCGSGWTTALLAELVGRDGRVIGFEIKDDLVEFGQNNLAKYDLPKAEIRVGNPITDTPDEAPFSRILVSAAADKIPPTLTDQLAVGGVMVIPVGESLIRATKRPDGTLEKQETQGFQFVPLQT